MYVTSSRRHAVRTRELNSRRESALGHSHRSCIYLEIMAYIRNRVSNIFNIPTNAFHEIMVAPPLRAMIIGHENVANLEWFSYSKTTVEGLANHVARGFVHQENLNAKWLDIDILYRDVFYEYLPKALDEARDSVEDRVEELMPNVVILDVISNDLAELGDERTPNDVAAAVFDLGYRLKVKYGVQVVDIFSCLRRTAELDCSPSDFKKRIKDCHAAIRVPCSYNFNVDFVKLSGFERLRQRRRLEMPVAYFSENGKVPGPDFNSFGFEKYRQNVRQALQSAVPKWVTGRRLGLY